MTQDDEEAGKAQWRRVAAAFLAQAESDVLAYMTFPAQHRAKLHSTNPI